jgi:hypothetical protein
MKRVTGIKVGGVDFRIVVDDEMAPDKIALVNDNGRGAAYDVNTGEVMDHIGPPLELLKVHKP